ncbi:hypothetical protein [Acidovorax temperans]|uniref:hypothetical protein n=1 Tax=Acidovorax temperans TaxID=80878 RepID=UPI0005CB4456
MKSALASGFAAAKVFEFVVPPNVAHFSRQPPLLPLQRRSGMQLVVRTGLAQNRWRSSRSASGLPEAALAWSARLAGGVQMFDKKCLYGNTDKR